MLCGLTKVCLTSSAWLLIVPIKSDSLDNYFMPFLAIPYDDNSSFNQDINWNI